jgi:hypothetical protein
MTAQESIEIVFNSAPPETLYHYTSQAGLLGIINTKAIWVTHSEYLNDRSEFIHAVEIIRLELEDRIRAAGGRNKAVWQAMLDGIEGHGVMNICVCSFSEDRDSLSQWRAYGGPTSGFAIGVPGGLVRRATSLNGHYLARCIYDPDEQRALLRRILDVVFQENIERQARVASGNTLPEDEDAPLGGFLAAKLNRFAPVMKHRKFSDEREWRVITRPLMNRRLSFREGKSTIIPYQPMSLDFQRDNASFALNELVVGPTPDPDRAARAVGGLLVSNGLIRQAPGRTVNNSEVPYRGW